MKLEVYSNNIDQAHRKLKKFVSKELVSYRTKIKHSNQKVNKKRMRSRK